MNTNGWRDRPDGPADPAEPGRRPATPEPRDAPPPPETARAEEPGATRGDGRRRSAVLRATPTTPDITADPPEQRRAAVPQQRDPGAPLPRRPRVDRPDRADTVAPAEADQEDAAQRSEQPAGDGPPRRRPGLQSVRTLARPGGRGDRAPAAAGARKPRVSWTTVAVTLAALLVAAWVVRGALSGTGSPSRSDTAAKKGQTTTVVRPHEKTATKPVTLNGNAIQAAGPVLTLNPALAQPGGTMTLSATGFDARSLVDVTLSVKGAKTGTSLGTFKTDKDGGFSAEAQIPQNLRATSVLLTAHQRNSDNVATAEAVTASGLATASVSKATGQPGKTVSVTAHGFSPGETVKVYWGRAAGPPSATLQADQGGGLSQAPVRVGVGGVGATTLVLVGAKSGSTATVPFYRLGLYPVAGTQPYAVKAGQDLAVTGSGFAPDEPVLVYVNTSSGPPALTAHADSQGNLSGLGFTVPFGLRGSQNLVLVGAKSRASVTSGFDVLPYSPTVQPSTYGGSPGTTFSFFAKGFAANEVVLVYLGRSKDSAGQLVSAFRVDDQGSAGAAGSYQITGADQGTLTFTLVGRKSEGRATTSLKVSPAAGPVDVPTRKPFTLPPDLRK